jgi:hypothetical protein
VESRGSENGSRPDDQIDECFIEEIGKA